MTQKPTTRTSDRTKGGDKKRKIDDISIEFPTEFLKIADQEKMLEGADKATSLENIRQKLVDLRIYSDPNAKIFKILEELSVFITKAVSTFEGVTISFTNTGGGKEQGQYQDETKKIIIGTGADPYKVIIHEGTHCLDALYMRIYQKEAVDWLADNLGDIVIKEDTGKWYSQAQKIINLRAFTHQYKFGSGRFLKGGLDKDNKAALMRYAGMAENDSNDKPNFDEEGDINTENRETITYSRMKEAFDALRSQSKEIDNNYLLNPLSEFSAHIIESLNLDWNTQDLEPDNLGKLFLNKIVKSLYEKFEQLQIERLCPKYYPQQKCPDFKEEYPHVREAFSEKLSGLGSSLGESSELEVSQDDDEIATATALEKANEDNSKSANFEKDIDITAKPDFLQSHVSEEEVIYSIKDGNFYKFYKLLISQFIQTIKDDRHDLSDKESLNAELFHYVNREIDDHGNSLLHLIASEMPKDHDSFVYKNHLSMASLLLMLGASPNIENSLGQVPSEVAKIAKTSDHTLLSKLSEMNINQKFFGRLDSQKSHDKALAYHVEESISMMKSDAMIPFWVYSWCMLTKLFKSAGDFIKNKYHGYNILNFFNITDNTDICENYMTQNVESEVLDTIFETIDHNIKTWSNGLDYDDHETSNWLAHIGSTNQ